MIQVDIRSRVPIYEQLYKNIRQLILQGYLKEDDKIPSVRELAATLTINPNTIQKAYKALEKDGFVYSVSGRGNFVSRLDEEKMKRESESILLKLDEAIKEAVDLKVPQAQVDELIKKRYREVQS